MNSLHVITFLICAFIVLKVYHDMSDSLLAAPEKETFPRHLENLNIFKYLSDTVKLNGNHMQTCRLGPYVYCLI